MDQRVCETITLMKDNLHRKLSLDLMAQSVSLKTSRLSYLFKAETGFAPAQYLKIIRMQQARHLLETTWLSVKIISVKVGVNDVSHFVRDFWKTYGLTPTEHRTRHLSTATNRKQESKIG